MKLLSGISKLFSGVFNFVANLFKDQHVQAMGRAGLGELTQALQAFPDSIKPVETYGLFGNPLPQTLHENLKEHNASEPDHNRDLEMNRSMEPELEMQM